MASELRPNYYSGGHNSAPRLTSLGFASCLCFFLFAFALLNFVRGFPLGRCMFIWNCIAQLLAFVPCRLKHATLRSHEANMVSGPSVHEDGALPSHSPCVHKAHHGEALRDPQRCSALAKQSQEDGYRPQRLCPRQAWDVAWPLPDACASSRRASARVHALCDAIFALWLLHVS
jgi:hypothetical protein